MSLGVSSDDGVSAESSLQALMARVDADPKVSSAKRRARSAQIDAELVNISGAPTLDFSTRGRYPITSEIDAVRDRFTDLDKRYIDGVFTVTVPLTDFGRRDAQYEAGLYRYEAARIEVDLQRQETLAELVVMLLDVDRQTQVASRLDTVASQLAVRVSEAKQRYEGGTGTLAVVRSLELKQLDVESDVMRAEFELNLLTQSLQRRFDIEATIYLDAAREFASGLQVPSDEFVAEILDSQAQLYLEQSALRFEARAIMRSRWPEVTGSVSGTLFDIDSRPGNSYDVVGGLNASMPLIDAGARDAELDQVALRQQILDEELIMDRESAESDWVANTSQRVEIEQGYRDALTRQSAVQRDLVDLRLRAQSLEARPTELALAEADLGYADVEVMERRIDRLAATVEALKIQDRLWLEAIALGQKNDH